jgi:ABC-2 type transport system ATP-binding protein
MPEVNAPAVETEGLRREYRRRRAEAVVALDDVSIRVERGEVHGLLGPNGAGKSTLMKILSTVLLPTAGTARVLGHDLVAGYREVRPLIGIVFGGERGVYPRLTARQNLRYWAALYGLSTARGRERADELLTEFGLAERADHRVETYSVGMRQRLHLARGLIADPRVLLLDEPTNGLDPLAARRLRETIGELASQGRTILLATHDLAEAEALCDRVTMINHGRVVAAEAPKALARLVSGTERIRIEGADAALLDRIRALPEVTGVEPADADGAHRVSVADRGAIGRVLTFVVEAGVTGVRTELPSLEEVYLKLVHRGEEQSVVAG